MGAVSTYGKNAEVDAICAALNAGNFKLYTGSPPASPDDAATGSLLATFTLSNPAFDTTGEADNATLNTATATATGAGDAGWGRFETSGGTGVMDVTVGTTGTDMIIDNVTIAIDDNLAISSYTYTRG